MVKNKLFLITIILLLAAFLRFYQLGSVPSGFHADEAAYGYNAYSLLLTSKDEYGKRFPLVLRSFDDYKPAMYSYLTIPVVKFFGLNEFSVRIPSALFGVFTVILVYFFTRQLFRNEEIAILSAFILAISPWHLNLSRTASEVVISVFFLILMSLALFNLQKKFRKSWFAVAVLSVFLAIGSYTASRFFTVIIAGLFLVFSLKLVRRRFSFNKPIFLVFILALLFGLVYSGLSSITRFKQINIFSYPQTMLILQEQIREDKSTPVLITRFFHNKPLNFSRTFLQNYAQYFTLDFLVLKGGYPQRQQVASTGLFYLWEIPFLLFGLYAIFHKRNFWGIFLIAWWLTSLVPAALTFDEIPNVYRGLSVLPVMTIIISIGIFEFFHFLSKRENIKNILIGGTAILIIFFGVYEFLYYQHQYFVHQEFHRPWSRQYSYKELVDFIGKINSNYDSILVTKAHSSPYIFFLFYQKYDPAYYQSLGSPRDFDYSGFDKYIFIPRDCPSYIKEEIMRTGKILLVDKGECELKPYTHLIRTIYWKDGTPAFQLKDVNKKLATDYFEEEESLR